MPDETHVKIVQDDSKPDDSFWLEERALFNKYFPTDRKSYTWRLPFVGLIVSVLTLEFLSMCIFRNVWSGSRSYLSQYCGVFIVAVVTYQLHNGLKIGDRRQYTPWIILKLVEIILTIANLIVGFSTNSNQNQWEQTFYTSQANYGFVLLVLNIGIIVQVFPVYLIPCGRSGTVDVENLYDTCEAETSTAQAITEMQQFLKERDLKKEEVDERRHREQLELLQKVVDKL